MNKAVDVLILSNNTFFDYAIACTHNILFNILNH